MPGYILVQLIGATLACLFLQAVIGVSASYGSNYPADGYFAGAAFWMEIHPHAGLVSVILCTASGAQNIGIVSAFGVGAYIAQAGLWWQSDSGTSMNPARTFGPDLVGADFSQFRATWRDRSRERPPRFWVASCCVGGVAAGRLRCRAGSNGHRDRTTRQGMNCSPRWDRGRRHTGGRRKYPRMAADPTADVDARAPTHRTS